MSSTVEVFPFAPALISQSKRVDSRYMWDVPVPQQEGTLAEDLAYVFSLSYFLAKATLKGFAIVSIPFWFATVGVISLLS